MIHHIFSGPALAVALLTALMLVAACDRQIDVRPTESSASVEADEAGPADEADRPRELLACDAPELEPIERATKSPAAVPVAYPGDELAESARGDRPFAPIAPDAPLPPALETRPRVVAVQPLPSAQPTDPAVPLLAAKERSIATPEVANRLVRRQQPVAQRRTEAQTPMAAPRQQPVAAPAAIRHPEAMQAVNRQVEQMIRRGYHLAERGALYSGRAEFVQALSTLAQALDLQAGGRRHTEALAAGLTALEEAEDFIPSGSALETDLDIPALLRAHHTPVCKQAETGNLLPVTVLQQYYTYAQEQLARASGGQEAASMAMLGLGKTYSTLAVEKSLPAAVAEPKAMVFHWAALSSNAGNFLAANELAVLEARWGQLATARSLLRYSLTILPHSAVWRNLATVHQRLGETKLAELALREADLAAKRESEAKPGNPDGIVPSSDVEWLDAKTFASTSRSEIDPQKPIAANDEPAKTSAKPAVEPAPPRQRSAAAWFPWFR